MSRALALVAALGAAALAGCAGDATPPGAVPLVDARVKDVVGLDPAHQTDGLSLNTTALIYQNLVKFKPGSFEIAPDLATAWRSSPDGKTWTFRIAPNVRFSDGTPADARAIKFDIDRWRDTKDPNRGNFPYPYYASEFGGFDGQSTISGVDAPSPGTLVLHLRTPYGPLLRNLAMEAFGIGSPTAIRKGGEAFELAPVGSGPYALGEWEHDDHVTLVANRTWPGGKPPYATVIIRDIPDQATSVLSMQKGDVDLLENPRPDDAAALAALPDVRLYHPPSNNVGYLALDVTKAPFGDVRVRRAIAYALDLPAMAKNLYGKGTVVADTWTPPGMLGSDAPVRAYPHDVARAKALLAQAGLAHGFTTRLAYPTAPRPYMPEPQRIAETIQADLAAAGITVALEPFEFGVFLTHARNGDDAMTLIGWTGDNGDPDNFLYPLLDRDSAVKGQAQNYSFWRDPAFHRLMLAGQRTIDESRRRAIYREANALVHDQAPAIPLVHSVVSFAAKTAVGGVVADPDTELEFQLMHPEGGS